MDLQKANFWKRISAYMFDVILTVCLALAVAIGVSFAFNYDDHYNKLVDVKERIEQEYQISFDITDEEYEALSPESKAAYDAANEAFLKNPETIAIYKNLIGMVIANVAISLLVADLVVYFVIPLLFKNGQTLGKKVFGLAVVRTNSVKITNPVLFIRSFIGLYVMETMVPLFIAAMMLLGFLGLVGTITLILLLILEVVVMIVTKTNSSIHDLLTDTVVVDFNSQHIFNSIEELTEYEKAEAARKAAEFENEQRPIATGIFAPRALSTTANPVQETPPSKEKTIVEEATPAEENSETKNDSSAQTPEADA